MNKDNDWVIYSDSDEIPNLEKFDLKDVKISSYYLIKNFYIINLIFVFQVIIGLDLKHVKSKTLIQLLSYVTLKQKNMDGGESILFLKKDKFINLKIVNDGGWHFTEKLKSPEEIFEKHKNDEHR